MNIRSQFKEIILQKYEVEMVKVEMGLKMSL